MGNGLLSLATGFAGGYMQGQQHKREQERQDKQDALAADNQAMHKQEFDARMEEVNREKKLRTSLAGASAPAQVSDNGAVMSLADGQKITYGDADVAGSDFRMIRRADEATGRQSLATQPASVPTAISKEDRPATDEQPVAMSLSAPLKAAQIHPPLDVTAPEAQPAAMSLANSLSPMAPQRTAVMNGKAYSNLGDAQAAAKAYDLPEARTERKAAAYDAAGYSDKADAQRLGAKQTKLVDMQLDKATADHLSDLANQKIKEKIAANGGNYVGALAQVLTETNLGGMKGVKADVRTTPDGKFRQIVLTKPDGTTSIAEQFDNNDFGQMRAYRMMLDADPLTKIKWLHDDHLQSQKDVVSASEVNKNNAQAKFYEASAGAKGAPAADDKGKAPAGYQWTSAGTQEPVPGGPADLKKQGAFNADTNALSGSVSSFDRLATAANEVLNHPGLNGITGWRGKIPNIPGSDAANAEALLTTLKSQVGFGVLQDMRNQSKTGGALGAVSEKELTMLQSNLAALDKAQSPEQYRAQLKKIIDYADQAKGRMRESFNLRHADAAQGQGQSGQPQGPGGAAGQKPGATPLAMPKTAAALQTGGIYQTSRGPAKWNGTAFEAQ